MNSPLESAGTIFEAAQSGNQEAMLVATRDRIALTLDLLVISRPFPSG